MRQDLGLSYVHNIILLVHSMALILVVVNEGLIFLYQLYEVIQLK